MYSTSYTDSNIKGCEICYFRNICNELYTCNASNDEGIDYLPLLDANTYIPQEDLLVFTTIKGEENLCPIPFTIDTKHNKIHIDANYRKSNVVIGSRNQFLYKRIPISQNTQSVSLPFIFRSGYDPKKYFVFLNGRLLNTAFYKILIPSLTNDIIVRRAIYFTHPVSIDDTLDVFYIGNNGFNKLDNSGSLSVQPFKVKAVEPIQRKFLIPKPYKEYPIEDYDSFMVFKHSVHIPTEKYKITKVEEDFYLEFLDVDDYLIYDEDLVFVYPYYRPDWEDADSLKLHNSMQFQTTTTVSTEGQKKFPAADPNINSNMYVFKDTVLASQNEYITTTNGVEFLSPVEKGTTITVIQEYNPINGPVNNDITLTYLEIPIVTDGQWAVDLPSPIDMQDWILFRNGYIIPKNEYSIVHNQIILGREYNNFHAGEKITAIKAVDGSNYEKGITWKDYEIKIKENASSTSLVVPGMEGLTTTNSLIFINGNFIHPNAYITSGNRVIFKSDMLESLDVVNVFIAIKSINPNKVQHTLTNKSYIRFVEASVNVTSDGKKSYTIPYSSTNNEMTVKPSFLVFLRGEFIPEYKYTLIKNIDTDEITTIEFSNEILSELKQGDVINFVFCYGEGFREVSKVEFSEELNSNTLQLPLLYTEPISLLSKCMVFYGTVYIDESRYTIDRFKRTITFKDIPYENDEERKVTVVFFYSASESMGSVGYLPKSGYLLFDETKIDRNLNKEMLMVFVNGQLVPKDNIYDLSNSLKKVTRNIKTRYDLNVINCSPLITEFKPLFNKNLYGRKFNVIIKNTPNQKIKVTTEDGKEYYSSFAINDGTQITAEVIPNAGYSAGNILIDNTNRYGFVVTKDIEITVEPAQKLTMCKVYIRQDDSNQIISVTCNEKIYTSDFYESQGSTFTAKISSTRGSHQPGKLHVTSGIVNPGTIITAEPATVSTFTINVLNVNLEDQDVNVCIAEANSTVYKKTPAPCVINSVSFGSKIRFESVSKSDSYKPGIHIGPFLVGKTYFADYKYPMDNLVIEPVTEIKQHSITLHVSNNQTVYLEYWTDSNHIRKRIEVPSTMAERRVILDEGTYYFLGVYPDYGYHAGNISVSSGDITGRLDCNISVFVSDAIDKLPVLILSRASNTSEYYSIIVDLNDGFQAISFGSYDVPEGTTFTYTVTLYDRVVSQNVYTMPNKVVSMELQKDGTVNIIESSGE